MRLIHGTPGTPDALRAVLGGAFWAAARELDFDHHHAVVCLTVQDGNLLRNQNIAGVSLGVTEAPQGDVVCVALREAPLEVMLSTLLHELVHVRQHLRRDLTVAADGLRWRGRHFPTEHVKRANGYGGVPADRVAYLALPWEEEAVRESRRITPAVQAATAALLTRLVGEQRRRKAA